MHSLQASNTMKLELISRKISVGIIKLIDVSFSLLHRHARELIQQNWMTSGEKILQSNTITIPTKHCSRTHKHHYDEIRL